MEAADPTLLAELLVAGRQPGEGEDQPPKPDGTEARDAPDHERHDDEPEAGGPQPGRGRLDWRQGRRDFEPYEWSFEGLDRSVDVALLVVRRRRGQVAWGVFRKFVRRVQLLKLPAAWPLVLWQFSSGSGECAKGPDQVPTLWTWHRGEDVGGSLRDDAPSRFPQGAEPWSFRSSRTSRRSPPWRRREISRLPTSRSQSRVAVDGSTPNASARSIGRCAPREARTTSARYCGSETSAS